MRGCNREAVPLLRIPSCTLPYRYQRICMRRAERSMREAVRPTLPRQKVSDPPHGKNATLGKLTIKFRCARSIRRQCIPEIVTKKFSLMEKI